MCWSFSSPTAGSPDLLLECWGQLWQGSKPPFWCHIPLLLTLLPDQWNRSFFWEHWACEHYSWAYYWTLLILVSLLYVLGSSWPPNAHLTESISFLSPMAQGKCSLTGDSFKSAVNISWQFQTGQRQIEVYGLLWQTLVVHSCLI